MRLSYSDTKNEGADFRRTLAPEEMSLISRRSEEE
jgi:hypothetical protein